MQKQDAASRPVQGASVYPEDPSLTDLFGRQRLVNDFLGLFHHQRRLERHVVTMLLLLLLLLWKVVTDVVLPLLLLQLLLLSCVQSVDIPNNFYIRKMTIEYF